MKIGIYLKKGREEIADLLKAELLKRHFELDDNNPDVVFSLGGDGSFLRTVHKYIDRLDKAIFIGLNNGTLGFLHEFSNDDISSILDKLEKGELKYKEHRLLDGVAYYKNHEEHFNALNEVRIENPFHTLIANVKIDNEELETFRGNGLIVSSYLGSSAYNKSLGGAIIDHDLNALQLTEIAGISNNFSRSLGSSLVISGNKKITFECKLTNTVVGYDYLNIQKEDELLKVEICYSNKKVKVATNDSHTYVQKIRKSFVL